MESSSYQATLGKQLFKLNVVDLAGQKVTFPRALARNIGKYLSALVFLLGFIMIIFNKKAQGLHDILAQCQVVQKD